MIVPGNSLFRNLSLREVSTFSNSGLKRSKEMCCLLNKLNQILVRVMLKSRLILIEGFSWPLLIIWTSFQLIGLS